MGKYLNVKIDESTQYKDDFPQEVADTLTIVPSLELRVSVPVQIEAINNTVNSVCEHINNSDEFEFDTVDDIEVTVEEEIPIEINLFDPALCERDATLDKEIQSLNSVLFTFAEVTSPPNLPIWKAAIDLELASIQTHNVWTIVDHTK